MKILKLKKDSDWFLGNKVFLCINGLRSYFDFPYYLDTIYFVIRKTKPAKTGIDSPWIAMKSHEKIYGPHRLLDVGNWIIEKGMYLFFDEVIHEYIGPNKPYWVSVQYDPPEEE